MALLLIKCFSDHEELPPPSRSDALPTGSGSAPALTQPPPARQDAGLVAMHASTHPETPSQLLSLAVLHIPVSLRLQLPFSLARATPLFTITQVLRQLFRLFIENLLQALGVLPSSAGL